MSLIPIESLLVILERLAIQQSKASDRLSLAIPMTDLLSYYGSSLIAVAVTVPEGLLMTFSIPLASRQTVFTLFEAKFIPMPYPDEPHLALSGILRHHFSPSQKIKWNLQCCPKLNLINA